MANGSRYLKRKRLNPSDTSSLKIGDRVEIVMSPPDNSPTLYPGEIIWCDENNSRKKLFQSDKPYPPFLHDAGGLGEDGCCYWLGIDNSVIELYLLSKLTKKKKEEQDNLLKRGRIITFFDKEDYLEF